jgi:hypothetical protein
VPRMPSTNCQSVSTIVSYAPPKLLEVSRWVVWVGGGPAPVLFEKSKTEAMISQIPSGCDDFDSPDYYYRACVKFQRAETTQDA